MNLNIKATNIFEKNWEAYNDDNINIIINQGGSRSSKTYSILQVLIIIAMTRKVDISIVRKSFPTLRGSILKDWIDIMISMDIYDEERHSKSEQVYKYENGSRIEFFSLDDPQKVRGRKRDILYIGEANEIDFDSWVQLKMRTSGKTFLDYNPSEIKHWSYDLINEPKSVLIKSTYLDNPFLGEDQIEYIENLIKVDQDYYKIYALGERVKPKKLVYNHFVKWEMKPPENEIIDISYGLDIGFNHETAFVEVIFATDNRLYVREIFYKNELTTDEIVNLVAMSDYNRTKMIYVDSARPDIIKSLGKSGIRASLSNKDVKEGIDFIKSKQVLININSENLWAESRLYSWKELKTGEILDEIDKRHDDGMDAMRYAAYTHSFKLNRGKVPFMIRS